MPEDRGADEPRPADGADAGHSSEKPRKSSVFDFGVKKGADGSFHHRSESDPPIASPAVAESQVDNGSLMEVKVESSAPTLPHAPSAPATAYAEHSNGGRPTSPSVYSTYTPGGHKFPRFHHDTTKLPNPFESLTTPGCYEYTKMVVMCVLLVPLIRLVLWALIALLMWVVAKLMTCCIDTKDLSKPLPASRRALFWGIRILCRAFSFVGGFYWVPTKWHFKRDKDWKPPPVIVSNHISMFDQFKLIFDLGCTGAGEYELWKIPFFGATLEAAQAIPVWRETEEGRHQSYMLLKKREEDLANGLAFPPLLIFPQGTTSNQNVLTMFKRGAFAAGTPVLPVAIRYPCKHYDNFSGVMHDAGYYVFEHMVQIINYQEIQYLPVYYPNDEEKKDPLLYGRNVRKVIAEALGPNTKTTEHEYTDVRLILKARKIHISGKAVDFVANEVLSQFDLKFEEVARLLERFKEMDRDNDSVLNLDEFRGGVGFDPRSSVARRLFCLFDTDDDGKIDFAEYLAVISACSQAIPGYDSLVILFELCDLDGNGKIHRKEFAEFVDIIKEMCLEAVMPNQAPPATPAVRRLKRSYLHNRKHSAAVPEAELKRMHMDTPHHHTPHNRSEPPLQQLEMSGDSGRLLLPPPEAERLKGVDEQQEMTRFILRTGTPMAAPVSAPLMRRAQSEPAESFDSIHPNKNFVLTSQGVQFNLGKIHSSVFPKHSQETELDFETFCHRVSIHPKFAVAVLRILMLQLVGGLSWSGIRIETKFKGSVQEAEAAAALSPSA